MQGKVALAKMCDFYGQLNYYDLVLLTNPIPFPSQFLRFSFILEYIVYLEILYGA